MIREAEGRAGTAAGLEVAMVEVAVEYAQRRILRNMRGISIVVM